MGYELQRMVSTDGSSMDVHEERLPSSLRQPAFTDLPVQDFPLKKRRSVHFGLFENNDNKDDGIGLSYSNEIQESLSFNKSVHFGASPGEKGNQSFVKSSSVGYSLSANELHAPEASASKTDAA